ncbi:MAG: hypothetical protein AAF654_10915 [Myxococcota bacterium]
MANKAVHPTRHQVGRDHWVEIDGDEIRLWDESDNSKPVLDVHIDLDVFEWLFHSYVAHLEQTDRFGPDMVAIFGDRRGAA